MKILFIDDHPEFAAVVSNAFFAADDLTITPTIAAAIHAAESDNFDVALVDYDLDDGKGTAFIHWARTAQPDLPLIAVSSHADGNAALLAAGADAVCPKANFSHIVALTRRVSRSIK